MADFWHLTRQSAAQMSVGGGKMPLSVFSFQFSVFSFG
jgi:hypothetical protein